MHVGHVITAVVVLVFVAADVPAHVVPDEHDIAKQACEQQGHLWIRMEHGETCVAPEQ